jgi:hypothetical protein
LSMIVEQRRALWLHCEKCFHMAKMPNHELMGRYGDLELQLVLKRAVCARCCAVGRTSRCRCRRTRSLTLDDLLPSPLTPYPATPELWPLARDRSTR